MAHKAELLTAMQAARAELEAIVAGFAGDLERDAGDGWRRQDVLAHIALWERMAARKIAGTPLPDGEDAATQEVDACLLADPAVGGSGVAVLRVLLPLLIESWVEIVGCLLGGTSKIIAVVVGVDLNVAVGDLETLRRHLSPNRSARK